MGRINKNGPSAPAYINNPTGMLAAEIVAKAVEDWRMLIQQKAWLPSVPISQQCNFDEIRNFLRSQWCELLLLPCEMDQQKILEILEAELQEAQQKHEERKDGKQ